VTPWTGHEDRRLLRHPHGQVLAQAQVAINAVVRAEKEDGEKVRLVRDTETGRWTAAGPVAEGLQEETPKSLADAKDVAQGQNLRDEVERSLGEAKLLPLGWEPARLALTSLQGVPEAAPMDTDTEEPTWVCAFAEVPAYFAGEWEEEVHALPAWTWLQEAPEAQRCEAAWSQEAGVVWFLAEVWPGVWTGEWPGEWPGEAAPARCGEWTQEAADQAVAPGRNGGERMEEPEQAEQMLEWPSEEELRLIRDAHLAWVAGEDDP
jgi:hypothetical protein